MGWLGTWQNRIRITIDNTNIDSDLTHFPLLLKLGSSVGQSNQDLTKIFDEVGTNSKKIAITKDDEVTQLYVEVAQWNSTSETAVLWISKSDLVISSSAQTYLYIYYDNNQVDNTTYVGDTGGTVAQNIWSSSHHMVQHFNKSSGTNAEDCTSNSRDGILTNMEDVDWQAGKIDNCLDFGGTNEYVNCGDISKFDNTDSFSYEFWINTISAVSGYSILAKVQAVPTPWTGIQLTLVTGQLRFRLMGSGGKIIINSLATINTGAWKHCIATYDGSGAASGANIYIDGVLSKTVISDALSGSFLTSNNFQVSCRSGTSNCVIAKLDEVMIHSTELNAANAKIRYHSQNDNLVTYGNTEVLTQFFGDASVLYTPTVFFSGYANLKSIETDTFTSHANLKKIEIKTFIGEASLLFSPTVFFNGFANLASIKTGIFTGDSNLYGLVHRTFTSDATLSKGNWTSDACLYDNDSKFLYGPWTYGGLFGGLIMTDKYFVETFTGDASFVGTHAFTFTSNTNLYGAVSTTFSGDASLTKEIQDQFTGDSSLLFIPTVIFGSDANLVGEVSTIFAGDAFLTSPRFTGDASLAIIIQNSLSSDAIMMIRHIEAFTSDTNLIGTQTIQFYGNSNLKKFNISTIFIGNASIEKVISEQFTGNASLKNVIQTTFTGDANLYGIQITQFNSDANLLKFDISVIFVGDANLNKIMFSQFTADASIKSIQSNTFTSDAYFTVERVEAFAGLVVLESINQFVGIAGTVDCISAATLGWGISGMEEFGIKLGI